MGYSVDRTGDIIEENEADYKYLYGNTNGIFETKEELLNFALNSTFEEICNTRSGTKFHTGIILLRLKNICSIDDDTLKLIEENFEDLYT